MLPKCKPESKMTYYLIMKSLNKLIKGEGTNINNYSICINEMEHLPK